MTGRFLARARGLALALVAAAALAGCASTPPDDVGDACEIFDDKGGWYKATARAEKRWGLPKATQLAILRQESGLDADARPPRGRFLFVFPCKRASSARGYPQAIDGTWDLYREATGRKGADRRSFSDAADFVGWYAAESRRRAGVPLSDAYAQYLAYHEGWGGYARGSWRGKPGLQRIARGVARTASIYEAQLAGCEARLRRGVPLIPFI